MEEDLEAAPFSCGGDDGQFVAHTLGPVHHSSRPTDWSLLEGLINRYLIILGPFRSRLISLFRTPNDCITITARITLARQVKSPMHRFRNGVNPNKDSFLVKVS